MKSKVHSKKYVELAIIPVPISADDKQIDDSKGLSFADSDITPSNDGSYLPGPESLSEHHKTVLVSTVNNITKLAQKIRDEQSSASNNDPQMTLPTATMQKENFSSYGSSKDDLE